MSKLADRRARQAQEATLTIPPGYVTITQTHTTTGIPRTTLQDWARRKRVDTRRVGRIWYVKLEDVRHVAATLHPGTKKRDKS